MTRERNELGQILPNENQTEVEYHGTEAPKKSPLTGVKMRERGAHRGKFQAFYRSPEGDVFTGEYRDSRAEAMLDLIAVKGRMYI